MKYSEIEATGVETENFGSTYDETPDTVDLQSDLMFEDENPSEDSEDIVSKKNQS
ncbi:MAG: hypothetical protein R3B51_09465 [Thermodesulfobacteriota bacterium]